MDTPHRQCSSRRIIVVALLAATLLGGAFVGFYQAGTGGAAAVQTPVSLTDDASAKQVSAGSKARRMEPTELAASSKPDDLASRVERFLASGDELELSALLPKGLERIDGSGGKGLQRQVKSGNLWFPVFDLSNAKSKDGSPITDYEDSDVDPRSVDLNEIPLAIASPHPRPSVVGQRFQHVFQAVGGLPPYRWSLQSQPELGLLQLDPGSGLLNAEPPDEAMQIQIQVTVTDSEGQQANAGYALTFTPLDPLTISTRYFPTAQAGAPYETKVNATGGVPPYSWILNSQPLLPLVLDPSTGLIGGTPMETGDYSLTVTVTDSQQVSVDLSLPLRVTTGLEITTENPLPTATPGSSYRVTMEASGGTPPYRWALKSKAPAGLNFAADGTLSGQVPSRTNEGIQNLDIEVSDSDGQIFRSTFQLAVMQALLAIPSKECVGLAWRPRDIERTLATLISGFIISRGTETGTAEIYRGTGYSFVDHGLATGGVYRYLLNAVDGAGRSIVVGERTVTVLPPTLQRARPGVSADPYADRVLKYSPLSANAYGANALPANVTGPPSGVGAYAGTTDVASLGAISTAPGGGSITLEFTDNIIELLPGLDVTVFENVIFEGGDAQKRFMEPGLIEVALFDDQWHRLQSSVNPSAEGNLTHPAYYTSGIAGVNATTGEDPSNPSRSGGDSFDLNGLPTADAGLRWVRYIRIRSPGDKVSLDSFGNLIRHTSANNALSGKASSGFDLDAVSAVNW